MDALLIAPPEARYVRAFTTREYLGLGYLASYLELQGCEAEIYNCNCRASASLEQAVARALEGRPPLVGITVPTLPNLPGAVHLVRALRAAGYSGHITIGGHVPTFQYRELLDALPGLSSIVRGEGEQTLFELVSACAAGTAWGDIHGLIYVDGELVSTPPRALLRDLDQLPFPRRVLGDVHDKVASGIAEVASSRGCYGNCNFCSVYSFYDIAPGKRFRWRSAENVVDELAWLAEEHGARTIIFVDDNFMGAGRVGRQRAARIAELILERGLNLFLNISCRANDIEQEVFALLKKAGLVRVFIGVESGVDSALRRYCKHVQVEQNLKALRILDDLDIRWDMGFMIYDPDTTFEELKENVNFLRKNRLYGFKAATLLLNGMVPFPGTPVEDQLRDEGRLQRRTLEALKFMGAPNHQMNYDDALRFLNYTYTLRDPRAQAMRRMIDFAYERLTPVYDAIWPQVADWEKWLQRAVTTSALEVDYILDSIGKPGESYRAFLHWTRGIGVLVMNLLEEMVELVKADKNLDDFKAVFEGRLSKFITRGYSEGLKTALQRSEDFFRSQSVCLEAGSESWEIPIAIMAGDPSQSAASASH